MAFVGSNPTVSAKDGVETAIGPREFESRPARWAGG
jgi:hypothetical protein